MLRRFFTITFALLLFALAFSIPRSTPAALNESPGIRIVANLFLPQIAIAQATASAPAQTVADNPSAVVVIDTGPGPVDTLSKSAQIDDKSSHSHAIVWGSLALIVVVALAAWFISRRSNRPST